MRGKHLMIVLILLVLALPAAPAHAGGVVSTCDETHLKAALTGGGTVTFSCSGTITLTSTLTIAANTTIDGSGQNVTISGGGAVRVFTVTPGVTLNLNKLTVANGNAGIDAGGGINNSGTLNVTNSTFSANSAKTGGGINNDHGTLTMSNSTFSANGNGATISGGGIYNNGGTATVSNSTFSDNQASYQGGGIFTVSGTLAVINSTFSGNSAGGSGGGGIFSYGSPATLKNTIVANSPTGGNCNGWGFVDGGGNLSYGDTTCPGINGDPKLGPLQDNGGPTQTMALGAGSAARDAAVDAICAAAPVNNLDQRGVARPQGAHCDIGAFEATPQAATCTVTSAADSGAGTLRDKLADTSCSTINFNNNYTINLQSELTIDRNVTIDGAGHTVVISGGGAVRVLNVPYPHWLDLNKLTIADAKSTWYGGGIYNGGSLKVTNCTFSGNSGYQGGGIFNEGYLTVTNSTFFGNNGGPRGGAIWSFPWLTVINSTFFGNSAEEGGGIWAGDAGNTVTLENTIIANSTAGGNCHGTITDGGGNLSYGDATCPGINGDPKLGPLQDNGGPTQTMALGAGSAARDAAVDAICAAAPVNNLDQRGVARPQGAHCDIGAYEAKPTVYLPLIRR